MIEHCRRIEHHLENQHCKCRRTERKDHGELDRHRQKYLDRMESGAGGHIEIEVGVVYAMQTPESGDRMKQHVLKKDGKIENDDASEDAENFGQFDLLQKPLSLVRCVQR